MGVSINNAATCRPQTTPAVKADENILLGLWKQKNKEPVIFYHQCLHYQIGDYVEKMKSFDLQYIQVIELMPLSKVREWISQHYPVKQAPLLVFPLDNPL